MNEQDNEAFETRSRALFQDSVDGLDMRIRSRLTQARSAALEAASERRRPWLFGWKNRCGHCRRGSAKLSCCAISKEWMLPRPRAPWLARKAA